MSAPASTPSPPRHRILARLLEREDALFARGLLWAVLVAALWLSVEADLDYAALPKGDFVSVLGWLFPGEGWGSPALLFAARALLWLGAPLWLLGSGPLRRAAAWACVAGMLLLGSTYWENLPWFRHKYVPPFWLLLLLALREHAGGDRSLAPRWVREGAVFILATFYGGAGVAKLVGSGWAWGDGVSLQLWFWRLGDETSRLREWIIASAPVARFFATGALLIELAACLAIPFRRVRAPLAVGLLLMHLGIDEVFGIDFRTNMLLVAVILLPWEKPAKILRAALERRAAPAPSPASAAEAPPPSLAVAGIGPLRAGTLAGLVFLSGLCGISYEVLYGRILGNLVGDQFSVSAAVLLTFMLGIGAGTLLAHRFWRWLWALEIGIGLCGALVILGIPWIDRFLYASGGALMLACALVLLAPSFLIGTSLPLFAGYLHAVRPSAGFNRTYALYNIGAALTALFVEFWLLRLFGVRHATLFVAGLNLLVGLALLAAFRPVAARAPSTALRHSDAAPGRDGSPSRPPLPLRPAAARFPRRVVVALVVAGVASAVFQLTLVKIMECLLGPFRETFALVLTTVLLGIALGSALVKRLRLGFPALMLAALAGLAWLLAAVPAVMEAYAARYHAATATPSGILALKFAVVLALMLAPAAAFGATIPALLGAVANVSRDSGRLLFWSCLANAAGFLLMAFGLHPYLDYGVLLLIAGALAALAAALCPGPRPVRFAALPAFAVLVLLHQGAWREKLLYVAYDAFHSPEALAAARATVNPAQRFKSHQDLFSLTRIDGRPYFFINGYISIPLDAPSEKTAAAFPAVFAPRADRALVLGVGSGATAGTVTELFAHTDAVEINEAVLANLDLMSEFNFDLLGHPRARLHHDDGIHYVKSTAGAPEKYSLVINTVTSPRFFSSSKLYTMEFLASVKRRLAPDGVYATYFDTRVGEEGADIMLRTLGASFRHCVMGAIKSGYFFVLCSDRPVLPRQHDLVARHPMLGEFFQQRHGLRPGHIPYGVLLMDATRAIGNPDAPLNTLDRPVLEFAMARLSERGYPAFLGRVADAIELAPVRDAFAAAGAPFDPHHLLFHFDNLIGGDAEVTQGWRRALYAEPGFRQAHLAREAAVIGRAAAASPAPAGVFFRYANKLKDRGDLPEAVAAYRRVLALDPRFDNAHFNLGATHEKAGDLDAAIAEYEAEKRVDPDEDESDLRIGRLLLRQGRPVEALRHLEPAARLHPADPDTQTLLRQARASAAQR